jgi:hypothetical protein
MLNVELEEGMLTEEVKKQFFHTEKEVQNKKPVTLVQNTHKRNALWS